MSLVDLPFHQFSPEELLLHLKTNRPCVVRGFLSPETVKQYVDHIHSTSLKKYMIGNVPAYYMEKTELAPNPYLALYQSDPDIMHSNVLRIWKHNKHNLTRWHYDGNGADLLNISLQGKKRFYLAPPETLPVYPFSNIAWKYNFKETHLVEIEPGDMLFLPAYWFHKVLTLEDHTININYIMYNKQNQQFASKRDQELFGLHNMFRTSMDPEILSLYQNQHPVSCMARGIYEMLPFFMVLIVFYFIARKYNKTWFMVSILSISLLIGFYLYLHSSLEVDTNGITMIVGFYLILLTLIFIVFEWNKNQEAFIVFT
jgi:hypothetical protein